VQISWCRWWFFTSGTILCAGAGVGAVFLDVGVQSVTGQVGAFLDILNGKKRSLIEFLKVSKLLKVQAKN
jgi:hypothetical protein